jgi:CRISPR/Cas system-associated exonuclease Cas4 (RecB family)
VPDVLQRAAIPLTPFGHPDIETWRNNRKGVTAKLNDLGLEVSGAIDDVLADANGRLYMCDFKSTTGNSPIETFGDKEHHESYQRQLEVYQWIFEQNGFETADTGYLIFGAAGVVETNGKLSIVFHESVISVQLDNGWVGAEVQKIKNTLDSNSAPSPNEKCGYCKYSQERSDLEKRG